MNKQKIEIAIIYCILATIAGLLTASLFVGCNLYEKEEVQIIRCPRIETDTITVPEWESGQGATEDVGH